MDKSYIQLFQAMISSAEVLAEKVAEYDEKKNDLDGMRTAQVMREDYANLNDKMKNNENVELTKSDFAKLLVAAYIVSNNMEIQLDNLQKTLNNYKTLIIPKLGRINDETKNDNEAQTLANELFGEINI